MLPLRGEKQMNKETLEDTTFFLFELNCTLICRKINTVGLASCLEKQFQQVGEARLSLFPPRLPPSFKQSDSSLIHSSENLLENVIFSLNISKLLTSHMYQS